MVPTYKMTLVLGLLRNCHYKLSCNLWVNNNVRNLPQQLHGQVISTCMGKLTHRKVTHCLHVYVLSCLPLCLTCLQLLWLMNNNNGMTFIYHSIFLTPKYIYMYEDGQVGLFHHKFLNAYQHNI